MRTLIFFIIVMISYHVFAQSFQITFNGSGLSTSVYSVKVQNLDQGTMLILNGSDTLELVSVISTHETERESKMTEVHIYPNPVKDECWLEFENPLAGDVIIEIYDLTGKCLTRNIEQLPKGKHIYQAGGLRSGIYIVIVRTPECCCRGRILASGNSNQIPFHLQSCGFHSTQSSLSLEMGRASKQREEALIQPTGFANTGVVQMQYNQGERLLLTGKSGYYARVVTFVPNYSQSVHFEFIDCTDGAGIHYPVVTIGNQTWSAENLKTTKYNNNTSIPLETNNSVWSGLTTPAYCWYNNDSSIYGDVYGAIYNWYALSNYNLCPAGWHVPNDSDWTALTDFLGGTAVSGGKLKETGTLHWSSPNSSSDNSSGFTALPGGFRSSSAGIYQDIGLLGGWWSSTSHQTMNAWSRLLSAGSTEIIRNDNLKGDGFSVRCIKNDSVSVQKPLGAFSVSDTDVFVGDTVYFTDLSSNYPTSWLWYFGDGDSSINANPYHQYTSAGIYDVTLIVSNIAGSDTLKKINLIVATFPFPVYDIDGHGYDTVHIGAQIWLKQNIRARHLSDGCPISIVTSNGTWSCLTYPAMCYYNNDSVTYGITYGALYNFFVINYNYGSICPTGWHVPSDSDWTVLSNYLGGDSVAGGKLKETGTSHWSSPNIGASNSYGFSALPSGIRHYQYGSFAQLGNRSYMWSSTLENFNLTAWARGLKNDDAVFYRYAEYMVSGLSVRCIKN